jgi:hypothetical protein
VNPSTLFRRLQDEVSDARISDAACHVISVRRLGSGAKPETAVCELAAAQIQIFQLRHAGKLQ